ncbi:protein FAR-RED IMPAIRED RESPONSE 1-like [Camellia sinensis]|uniref:protein FAR-RED IMPAIRED RESPONSE 1-like n=1 Tax=Camellia sinensis TaxID=4442 RepID=UPI001036AE7D|nr:protein FAR-RED IMPAIRED RESPONSE 1-like [Camellia sinensis]
MSIVFNFEATMDIDSNNNSLNGSEEVEEQDNNLYINESGEVEEPKKGMYFSLKQEAYAFYAKYAKHCGFAIAFRSQNLTSDGERILNPVKKRLEVNDAAGIGVARNFHSMVVEAGGYEALTFDERDARNYIEKARRLRLGLGDAESSILFGCGLLSNENTETFVWLFKEWLSCMSDVPPKAIIAYQCRAMQNAIEIVFQQARHRWCLWHVMKKIPEKLRGYSQYEGIKVALQNAVYDSFTKDEFEGNWLAMVTKFNMNDNEWLGVLYRERHRWILAYVKDIFWAGMSTTGRSKSMNAFFYGYVNSKTTLKQFVERY